MGADYKVSFVDDGKNEYRRVLYRLENKGIVKNESMKDPVVDKSERSSRGVHYRWVLANKGREICKKHEHLFTLWEEGKIFEFEEEIEKFLDEKS